MAPPAPNWTDADNEDPGSSVRGELRRSTRRLSLGAGQRWMSAAKTGQDHRPVLPDDKD